MTGEQAQQASLFDAVPTLAAVVEEVAGMEQVATRVRLLVHPVDAGCVLMDAYPQLAFHAPDLLGGGSWRCGNCGITHDRPPTAAVGVYFYDCADCGRTWVEV